jgi:hypothetical protein
LARELPTAVVVSKPQSRETDYYPLDRSYTDYSDCLKNLMYDYYGIFSSFGDSISANRSPMSQMEPTDVEKKTSGQQHRHPQNFVTMA